MAINNLAQGTTEAIHMRCPSSSGGKDWVGSITSNGELHTFWGKTGHISQHAAKPATKNGYISLISEKANKGYVIVDRFETGKGWESQQPAPPRYTSASPSTPSPQPFVPTAQPVKILRVEATADEAGQATGPSTLVWDF